MNNIFDKEILTVGGVLRGMISEVEARLHSSVVFHAPVDVPRQVKCLMGNQLISRNCQRGNTSGQLRSPKLRSYMHDSV